MLARLEAIDGVATAEVDHSGRLLLLRLGSDQALDDAVQMLRELGYGADELGEAPAVQRWYGRDTVRELSREEGDVIARRVVPAFARGRRMVPGAAGELEGAVARALSDCFTTHGLDAGAVPGELRRECIKAVEIAVRGLVGEEGARELAALLSADLGRAGPDARSAG